MSTTAATAESPETSSVNYLDADFESWLNTVMDHFHCPGLSVAVVDNGQISSAGYGLAILPDVPATANTRYAMGSTTKAITAASLGSIFSDESHNPSKDEFGKRLKRKIDWTTPIKKVLASDFVIDDQYLTDNITIEDALSHRTGLPGHDYLWGPWLGSSPAEYTRRLRHLGPPNEPFRSRWQYNNLMYAVMGDVIEKLTSKSYADVLQERIWGPLQMHDTCLGVEAAREIFKSSNGQKAEFARGYRWVEGVNADNEDNKPKTSGSYSAEAWLKLGGAASAGDVISTVKDYAKLIVALLEASKPPEDKKSKSEGSKTAPVISHETWKELTTSRSFIYPIAAFATEVNPLPANPQLNASTYGLGLFLQPTMFPGNIVVRHAGGLPGFGAELSLLPQHDFGVVTAGNSGLGANWAGEAVVKELMGRKLGLSVEERRFQPKKNETSDQEKKQVEEAAKEDLANPSAIAAATASNTPPSTDVKEGDIAGAAGKYTQPAYGTFIANLAPTALLHTTNPTLENHPILRKPPKPTSQTTKQQQSPTTQPPPILILPHEKRSLHFSLLLHNPRHLNSTPNTLPNTTTNNEKYIIFDLEKLILRGSQQTDCFFTGLPPGVGKEDDERYPCRSEPVWESEDLVRGGAALLLKDGKVEEMGLQIFRTIGPDTSAEGREDGEEGWRGRMVWFRKGE